MIGNHLDDEKYRKLMAYIYDVSGSSSDREENKADLAIRSFLVQIFSDVVSVNELMFNL